MKTPSLKPAGMAVIAAGIAPNTSALEARLMIDSGQSYRTICAKCEKGSGPDQSRRAGEDGLQRLVP